MSTQKTVLVVGGTGRTGLHLLQQLLGRGLRVRAILRSRGKLPPHLVSDPNLTVIEASISSLRDEELAQHLLGCDAVLSCLGHVLTFAGIFGAPRDLVTRATLRICRGIEALRPPSPVAFILMGSVSVNGPPGLDTRRGALERALLSVIRALIPPSRDNQRAADFLIEQIGPESAFVHWVALRPDTLLSGEVSEYTLHEGIVDSLFKPGSTHMANVAHFMCELVTNPTTLARWRSKLPVIVDAPSKAQ